MRKINHLPQKNLDKYLIWDIILTIRWLRLIEVRGNSIRPIGNFVIYFLFASSLLEYVVYLRMNRRPFTDVKGLFPWGYRASDGKGNVRPWS